MARMRPHLRILGLIFVASVAATRAGGNQAAPRFEVASIKPTAPDYRGGRFATLRGVRQFMGRNYTVKTYVALAYGLTLKTVTGGPTWADTDPYDIDALTPGDTRPGFSQQMAMLRQLLEDRFKLTYRREEREMPLYALAVERNGPKLTPSKPEVAPTLINRVFADRVVMEARHQTLGEVVAMMQRAVVDRPMVDRTGATGEFDFDLEWVPDASEFNGELRLPMPDSSKPGLVTAMREQLGLRLQPTSGPVAVLVIEGVERPSEN